MKKRWKRFIWWLYSDVCDYCHKRRHRAFTYAVASEVETKVVECYGCFVKNTHWL